MNQFPDFMKSPVNLIGKESQYTDEIEGYVFNGDEKGITKEIQRMVLLVSSTED